MAKPIPALRNLKTAQMVKGCTKFAGFLDDNLQAVSSPVADYVKNNPVPHLVRCFISAVMNSLPRDKCLYPEIQECCSQGGSETTRFNPDGGDFCDHLRVVSFLVPALPLTRLRETRRT